MGLVGLDKEGVVAAKGVRLKGLKGGSSDTTTGLEAFGEEGAEMLRKLGDRRTFVGEEELAACGRRPNELVGERVAERTIAYCPSPSADCVMEGGEGGGCVCSV